MLTVFYGDQVFGEYPDWHTLKKKYAPEGAYIYDHDTSKWYQITIYFEPIEDYLVPAMCKAWLLIL